MNKYLKYTLLIFIGIILMTNIVDAEIIQKTKTREQINNLRDQVTSQIKKEKEKEAIKSDLDTNKVNIKSTIEEKRLEFKKEIEAKILSLKQKTEIIKAKLKNDILKIKDNKKKETVTNIITKIEELNNKAINNLNEITNKIEDNIIKIEIRANDDETKGLDVSKTKELIIKAKASVVEVRALILSQSTKVYTTNITADTALKGSMSKVKESLNTDIKTIKEKIKNTRDLTRNATVSLAQTEEATLPKVENSTKTETTN